LAGGGPCLWAEPGHDCQDVPVFGATGVPGYVRTRPPDKPKLGALMPMIEEILEARRPSGWRRGPPACPMIFPCPGEYPIAPGEGILRCFTASRRPVANGGRVLALLHLDRDVSHA
jgi:hypothetical protein